MTDREEADLTEAMRDVLSAASGKRVLFWILEQAAIYRDGFSGDNNATNYVLGQQSIGRKIIERMGDVDPRAYPTLLLEIADMKAVALAAVEKPKPKQWDDKPSKDKQKKDYSQERQRKRGE